MILYANEEFFFQYLYIKVVTKMQNIDKIKKISTVVGIYISSTLPNLNTRALKRKETYI